MKPIPPGYCEAADNAPIPGRPWWTLHAGGHALLTDPPRYENEWLVRRDGQRVSNRAPSHLVIAEAERIDAAHPLPHPGYRAGQVWLHASGTTTTVLEATGWQAWGVTDSDAGGAVLGRLFLAGCWLLHDPLMPSRAPWGPA